MAADRPLIALVAPAEGLPLEEVRHVAAALAEQVAKDLAPVWDVDGQVEAFAAGEVPDEAWPLWLVEDTGMGAGVTGFHQVQEGRPFGRVLWRFRGWPMVAGHQCLEMLVDPFVDRYVHGPSPRPDGGEAEFLLEICDPCQAFGYDVAGVHVSDFVTPAYYSGRGSTEYSRTGRIEEPRQVPRGGYLRWREPATGHSWRMTYFAGSAPQLEDLGRLEEGEPAPALGRAKTAPEPAWRDVLGRIEGEVEAAELVRALAAAGAVAPAVGEAAASAGGVQRRTADDWIGAVRTVYRPDVTLDAPLVAIGLAILDPPLRAALADRLDDLEAELPAPLDTLVESGGTVRPLSDRPADDDALGRAPYARFLADLLAAERASSRAQTGIEQPFLVHLYGPWGAGKTSLLRLLERALRLRKEPWLVVWFNAWQHERLGPPWWSLLAAVRRQARRGTSRRALELRALELLWRIRLGWMAYLLLPAVLALLWVAWQQGLFDSGTDRSVGDTLGDIAKAVTALAGLLVTVLGAARGLARSVSASSARGADTFVRSSRDPMRTLTKRFNRLVRLTGQPVAVFIDDLDRCQARYVVDLLQGIQTLLLEAPVTFVVAADRRWLYDSYARVYRDFTSAAREPGRPLGHLFLEKTFQVSAPLPNVLPTQRDAFWLQLIAPPAPRRPRPGLRPPVQDRIRRAETTRELAEVLGSVPHSADEDVAQRSAVLERLGDPDMRARTETELRKFSPLLEPNPRAMKRFVNAYSVAQALHVLQRRVFLSLDELALWTLLSMRWPLLADCVAEHPEVLAEEPDGDLDADLRALLASADVRRVLAGGTVAAPLTAGAVEVLSGR